MDSNVKVVIAHNVRCFMISICLNLTVILKFTPGKIIGMENIKLQSIYTIILRIKLVLFSILWSFRVGQFN